MRQPLPLPLASLLMRGAKGDGILPPLVGYAVMVVGI